MSISIAVVIAAPADMTDERRRVLARGADEVIEVGDAAAPPIRVASSGRHRYLQARQAGAAHAHNLGVSRATCDWVALCFGDEHVEPDWLDVVRRTISAQEPACCIHLFAPRQGAAFPIVVVRRQAFVYGHLDERHLSGRLAALHWVVRVFPRPKQRLLLDEGVARHSVDFVIATEPLPRVQFALAALLEVWDELSAAVRAALLSQAADAPEENREALLRLRAGAEREAAVRDPYRSGGDYDPKSFWETNTVGYIRWEIYQPDEPEILSVIDRVVFDSVLELGCGAGRNTRYFASAGRYAGIDISMHLLRRAAERQEANSIGIVCGDASILPFRDASFDLVFADSTIQHIRPERITACVAELVRVSREYICLIEYTEEEQPNGRWFEQIHMFAHDYASLFAPHCRLMWRADTALHVHPARKEVFLFQKT